MIIDAHFKPQNRPSPLIPPDPYAGFGWAGKSGRCIVEMDGNSLDQVLSLKDMHVTTLLNLYNISSPHSCMLKRS